MRATAAYSLALAAVLAAAAFLGLAELGADPPLDGARDLSLSTDGAWYAGAALDRARGLDGGHGGPYDRPIFSALVAGFAWFAGPGLAAATLSTVVPAVLAIALTSLAARRAHGPVAGVISAVLLAADYAFWAQSRAPSVYPVCALASAAVLLCLSSAGEDGRLGWRRVATAWAITIAGALWLKSILFLMVPALIWALPPPRRALRVLARPWAAAALFLVAAAALAISFRSGWLFENYHKLREYVLVGPGAATGHEGGLAWRLLALEPRAGLFAASPAILILAVFWALAGGPAKRPAERLGLGHLVVSIAALAPLQYAPLRYFLPVYPALALLGASFCAGSGAAREPARLNGRRVLGGYLVLQGILALFAPRSPGILSILVAGSAGAALAVDRFKPARCLRWAALAGAAFGVVFGAGRSGVALAEPRRSIERASGELEAIVAPCAYLTGPFAHALTYESPIRRKYIPRLLFGGGRLAKQLRGEGFTHLVVDLPRDAAPFFAAFAADGAELEPIWEFSVRGRRVGVFRFPWSSDLCPPTEFERGIAALRARDHSAAERFLRGAVAAHPASGAAGCALGAVLLGTGREEDSVTLLEEALRANPDELRAARCLVGIYLKRGDTAAARRLLVDIARADPEDAEAARLAETLGRVSGD